ncbi:hypothetical protein [Streptomyces sp. bgisy060]|uniref:hypothetical protein n=1 Tax=Streptomyces sp. bgisy060 TaxID=3413775 RepID=UPI003EBEAA2B
MSAVVEVVAECVPPGTPVVVYACLPPRAGPPPVPDRVPYDVLRHVDAHGWVPVAAFVDRAAVLSSRADRPEWPKVLAMVEAGMARGIVAPSPVTLWFHPEERDSLVSWLRRTGAFVSTSSALTEPRRRKPADSRTGRPPATGAPRWP